MSQRLLVADSGPLIALGRLGLLQLPIRLFSDVLVTQSVWDEVASGQARAEHGALVDARQAGWLTVVADPAVVAAAFESSPLLDKGERMALTLSMSLPAGCDVLIDERRGRAAAAQAGLSVLGTLGLLVRAKQLGLIGPVRPLTDELLASGYHLGRYLVAETLASLGE
jgi:predicted nucleic acid-binding protein